MDDGLTFSPVQNPVTCAPRLAMVDASSCLEAKSWMLPGKARSRSDAQNHSDISPDAECNGRNLAQRRGRHGSLNRHAASLERDVNMAVRGGRGEKKPKIQLPPFPTLGTLNLTASMTTSTTEQINSGKAHSPWASAPPKPHASSSWPPASLTQSLSSNDLFGRLAPLTPPQEADSFRWSCTVLNSLVSPNNNSLATEQEPSQPELSGQRSSATSRPTTISLPGFVNNMSDQNNSPSTWLERAVSTIGEC